MMKPGAAICMALNAAGEAQSTYDFRFRSILFFPIQKSSIPTLKYLLTALPSRDYVEEKGKEREMEKDSKKTTLKKSGARDLADVPKKNTFRTLKKLYAGSTQRLPARWTARYSSTT